jgi:hypothetical protein
MSIIARTLKKTAIGNPVCLEHLVMFPLLGPVSEPGYITLDEAIAAGSVEIREVSNGGSVPEVLFINRGDRPVFAMDGEELVGAKQNRILNLSTLVDAQSTVTIPVSCVEQGRWSPVSRQFSSAPRTLFARGRARVAGDVSASLKMFAMRRSDQLNLWDDIARYRREMRAEGETGAMDEIYRRHATSLRDFEKAMQPVDGQTGALFFVGRSLTGMDLFDCEATLRALLPKVVQGNALDALDCARRGLEPPAPTLGQARAFLDEVAAAEPSRYEAVGMGFDLRIARGNLTGGALELDGRLVHLYAFRLTEDSGEPGRPVMSSRAIRASRRCRPPEL